MSTLTAQDRATNEFLGMEGLAPTIHRKYDANEESIFRNALATMHKVSPEEITMEEEGNYKIYKINGGVIFRDRA
jgi:hypothetical protein